jgi:site-specific recombinase XerC
MYKISQVEDYMNTVKLDKSPQTVRSYDLAIRKLFDFLKIETFENIVSITPANIREFQTGLGFKSLRQMLMCALSKRCSTGLSSKNFLIILLSIR